MSHRESLANNFKYGRTILQAGIRGLRRAEQGLLDRDSKHYLAESAREALVCAALGGGLAALESEINHRFRGRLARVLACGSLAFCADFAWRTRNMSSHLMDSAAREITMVRDQHWLEENPIDYA
jgi:hypothetical protein